MNTYTKFCKDCAHIIAPPSGYELGDYAKCGYGFAMHPVTGRIELPTQRLTYCIGLRQSADAQNCGPDARFFEPKEAT
jgi:hypothetical protein